MMVGGSIEQISVDSRNFAVAAGSDVKLTLGGYKPTVQRNGNGTTRITGEKIAWSLTDIDVAIDFDNDDLGFLQRTADDLSLVPCVISLADGTKYMGDGCVAEELEYSTGTATARLSLKGAGELTTQVDPFITYRKSTGERVG